jgi:L-ascorbate metabolism protein UlaG (beta-lactamase superfamily)
MRITYYGHSSFLVEAQDGTRIILDPYRHGAFDGALRYAPIDEPADVVLASHEHDDHGATDTIPGRPQVFVHPVTAKVGGVRILGIEVAHDEAGGSKRGKNTIVVLDDGDVRLAHLGDLGHPLDEGTIEKMGRVDILMVPVGGFFTIDRKEAAAVVEALAPRVVLPMHYKTDKVDFPIAPVDQFLATQATVRRETGATLELTKATLPEQQTTIVLEHAR